MKNALLILTLRCDQSSQLMSKSQDSPLSKPERWALSFHLCICRFCRKYRRQLKLLHEITTKIADSQTYDTAAPTLLDPEQSKAFQERLSKNIRENLDSM